MLGFLSVGKDWSYWCQEGEGGGNFWLCPTGPQFTQLHVAPQRRGAHAQPSERVPEHRGEWDLPVLWGCSRRSCASEPHGTASRPLPVRWHSTG